MTVTLSSSSSASSITVPRMISASSPASCCIILVAFAVSRIPRLDPDEMLTSTFLAPRMLTSTCSPLVNQGIHFFGFCFFHSFLLESYKGFNNAETCSWSGGYLKRYQSRKYYFFCLAQYDEKHP